METKQCSKCLELKLLSEFYKQLDGLRAACKTCAYSSRKDYAKTDAGKLSAKNSSNKYALTSQYWENEKRLYTRAKASAKQRNKIFSLSYEEFSKERKLPCYYCEDLLRQDAGRGIGLDRIDNSKGYEIGNVLSCCGFCNTIRGEKLSIEEMKKVASILIEMRNLRIS